MTRSARQRYNQPDKRHKRSRMRGGGAIRGGGAPVVKRHQRGKRQRDNQPDNIDKRGRWR